MSLFDDAFEPFGGAKSAGVGSGLMSAQDLMFAPPGNPIPMGDIGMDTMGIPKIGPLGAGSGSGFGLNLGTANLALSGLGTLGNLWGAFQAQKLAKKQFSFSKQFAESNRANQIKSYNTTLEDRGRSRAAVEDQSGQSLKEYIDKNKLG